MKQEEKNLVIKDICTRLPYGVKIHIGKTQRIEVFGDINLRIGSINNTYADIRPYLFPLSSMTEEQYNSLHELGILDNCSHSYEYVNPHIHGVSFIFKQFKTYSLELIEWLNKNHFDYRGLIEKRLAIDATNLNIY